MTTFRRVVRSRTLRHLPPALLVAAVVEVALRTTTLPRLASLLGVRLQLSTITGPDRHCPVPPSELGALDAARYQAARRVLQMWPWGGGGKCLRLALVAGWMLRRRRPDLHLGVAHIDGHAVAHAWLSVNGTVLDPTAHRYTPLVGRG